MKLVIIGGTGLIGSKLVTKLRERGHDAVAASPNTGVNTLTGEGLAEVLQGACTRRAAPLSCHFWRRRSCGSTWSPMDHRRLPSVSTRLATT